MYEVRFCNPVYQTNATDSKASLIFLRDETTTDENLKRKERLTSGTGALIKPKTLRNAAGKALGVTYTTSDITADPKVKNQVCKTNEVTKQDVFWKTLFTVTCDTKKTGALSKKDLSVYFNQTSCEVYVNAVHNAGCATVEASGMVSYLQSNPWLMGLLFLAVGGVTCFMGAKIFDEVLAALGGLIVFVFVSIVSSSLGGFDSTVLTIFSLIFALGAAGGAGWVLYNTLAFQFMVLGGIAGFFAGFMLYALVIAQFIVQSAILLWITLIASAVAGGYLTVKKAEHLVMHITAAVGAYMIARGLSYFFGGFPDEAETFSKLQTGTFSFPFTSYLYLALIVGLTVGGSKFQDWMDYEKTLNLKRNQIKSLREGLIDNEHA